MRSDDDQGDGESASGFGSFDEVLQYGREDEVMKREHREPVETAEEALGSKLCHLGNC
jgi:hypothetical protein